MNMTFLQAIHRMAIILLWIIVILVGMRLMAWSDTGMHGGPIETNLIPIELKQLTR